MGFNHFRKASGIFIIYSLIFLLAISNPGTGLILGGPMLAGYYLALRYLPYSGGNDMGVFFRSFEKFLPFLILNLLMTVVILLGLLMLIIPGIYLSVSYLFAHLFVVFYDLPPAEALSLSRKMVSGNFTQILWIWLIILGLNMLGTLAFGVGLLITIPVSACVLYVIFDDIIGIP